jgi:hypothetical protein
VSIPEAGDLKAQYQRPLVQERKDVVEDLRKAHRERLARGSAGAPRGLGLVLVVCSMSARRRMRGDSIRWRWSREKRTVCGYRDFFWPKRP